MMQGPRSIQAAFSAIAKTPTPFSQNTSGTTPDVLVADRPTNDDFTARRVTIVNTHATQSLAMFFVPKGTAASGQTVTSPGGRPILAGQSWEFVAQSNMRMLIVGSGAGTTYNGFVEDS